MRVRRWSRARRWVARACAAWALAALSGCTPKAQPVIPKAAFIEKHDERFAAEGRDSTIARIAWPECVGARTPMALDSLKAAIQSLALAPAGHRRSPANSIPNLLDNFIAEWNAERKATHRRMFWRLDRRIGPIADTLGVVSFARTDFESTGGARPVMRVKLVSVGADLGETVRFDQLFRDELRDSLDDALAPLFRAARGMAPDSSLAAAGFAFADSVFHSNDNFALVGTGVRWHFDPGEAGPESLGATDFVAPFDAVRAFAKEGGPLWPKR